jgi:TRAP-type C4-dicarboxylate transport system substrate-binding protein
MKKSLVLFLGVLLLTIGLLVSCQGKTGAASGAASPQAASGGPDYGPKLELTFGSSSAATDITTQGMQLFKKNVEERSGGMITINLYPASQLGPSLEQVEMVSDGSIDLFIEANFLTNFGVDDAQAGGGFFMVKTPEEYVAVVSSPLYQKWYDDFRTKNNIRIVEYNWYRNWASTISRTPIRSLEEFKGKKIRVPPSQTTIRNFTALGAAPTPVAYNETMLALQTGTVDGAWLTQDAMYSMGFYEVAKHVWEMRSLRDCLYTYMNEDRYQSITENQRKLILDALHESGDFYTAAAVEILNTNKRLMEEAGCTFYPISDADWNECEARIYKVQDDLEAGGAWSKGLNQQIRAVLANARK